MPCVRDVEVDVTALQLNASPSEAREASSSSLAVPLNDGEPLLSLAGADGSDPSSRLLLLPTAGPASWLATPQRGHIRLRSGEQRQRASMARIHGAMMRRATLLQRRNAGASASSLRAVWDAEKLKPSHAFLHPFFEDLIDSLQVWDADELNATVAVFNPSLSETEPLLEPWRVTAAVAKQPNERFSSVRVEASPLHLNVTPALLALQPHIAAVAGGGVSASRPAALSTSSPPLLVRNRSGVPLRAALHGDRHRFPSSAAVHASSSESGASSDPLRQAPTPRVSTTSEWSVNESGFSASGLPAAEAPPRAPLVEAESDDPRLARGCSAAVSLDALGAADEISFEGGGVLGVSIEPGPPGFELLSSSVAVCPRFVVINRLPESLQLRAEVLPARGDVELPAAAPPHVELAAGSRTDVYCFEGGGADAALRDASEPLVRASVVAKGCTIFIALCEYPLADIKELPSLELPGGRKLYVATFSRLGLVGLAAPLGGASRLQLQLCLSAVSVSLVESGPKGTPRELLGAALRGVRLRLAPSAEGLDTRVSVDLLQLAPLTLALEATVLARLAVIVPRSRQGQAGGGDGGESGGAHGARLLVQRLSATLEEPPDWSRRRPIYIESLLIGQIDLTISSALEVQRDDAPRQPAGEAARGGGLLSVGGGGAPSDWMAAASAVPLLAHALQSMVVLAKGIGLNFASVSGVPLSFATTSQQRVFYTPSELLYRLRQTFTRQLYPQLGKAVGHSQMLGDPLGALSTLGSGLKGCATSASTCSPEAASRYLLGGVGGFLFGPLRHIAASLNSVVGRMNRPDDPLLDGSPNAQPGRRRDGSIRVPRGKDALRTFGSGFSGIVLKPVEGLHKDGALGAAKGVAEGLGGCVVNSAVSAPLQFAAWLSSGAEQYAMRQMPRLAGSVLPPLRPARDAMMRLEPREC
ncbi:hypothetical protein EMIHUDRAFT_453726 [Emiliania huxleyi CCMP1516]|uniref:Vacuolar protein sorting-associated protein 13 DH-like domain-containing protein n=2 Tax=Emiliania huxleyi TaxID=2903 RepID=A0A0D3I125_EMIH1|nr:hypothetical protein EMIHUDRAFT_453726 [Emiliania huxleyi CCMP1516]EOD04960.1 hypothetical protein EMIHUDRAFT_453726 [Emiliania huxleyi CCMP1516]|eukprot:XP_005757389.1 hypothetical protein EMIHUDRAFT_453726 [Emiliania huxleyi CCMP1516]